RGTRGDRDGRAARDRKPARSRLIPPLAGTSALEATVGSVTEGAGSALTVQLLEWGGGRARSDGETLRAWESACPRLTIWEDAVADGLVRVARGHVELTPSGERHVREATDLA